MSEPRTIKVNLQRFDSGGGTAGVESYEVPVEPGSSVMTLLTYIYENLDPSISYYNSCRIGKCLGCDMGINGTVDYACTTPVPVDGELTITPLPEYVTVKDMVIDRDRPKRPAGKKPVIG
jgi:fumarate reductase iron-sulfur subunit